MAAKAPARQKQTTPRDDSWRERAAASGSSVGLIVDNDWTAKPEGAALKRAVGFLDAGRYREAFDICDEVKRIAPDWHEVYIVEGILWQAVEGYAASIASYTMAIKLYPADRFGRSYVRTRLAESFLSLGLPDEAMIDCAEAGKLVPATDVESNTEIARLRARIRRRLKHASRLRGDKASEIYFDIGSAFGLTDQFAEAIPYLRKAVEIAQSEDLELRAQLTLAYTEQRAAGIDPALEFNRLDLAVNQTGESKSHSPGIGYTDDASSPEAAAAERLPMGKKETIDEFAADWGMTVAQLEEAASSWKAAHGEVAPRKPTARAKPKPVVQSAPSADGSIELSTQQVLAVVGNSTLGRLQQRYHQLLEAVVVPPTTLEEARTLGNLVTTYSRLRKKQEELDVVIEPENPRITEMEKARAAFYRAGKHRAAAGD